MIDLSDQRPTFLTAGSRKRAAPASLPPNLEWLDHVTLTMTASRATGADMQHRRGRVLYDLNVQVRPADHPDAMHWNVQRSFSEYLVLQQRLLTSLQHGHACHAECGWLHSVLKNHFPKKALFCSSCKVESRRQSLLRILSTVLASVINRGNLSCSVLRDRVLPELGDFLMGGSGAYSAMTSSKSTPSLSGLATSSSSSSLSHLRRSSSSLASDTSIEDGGDIDTPFETPCRGCAASLAFGSDIGSPCGHKLHVDFGLPPTPTTTTKTVRFS